MVFEFLRALNSDLYFHISVPVLVSVLLCTHTQTHTHSGVLRTANFPTFYYISGASELLLKVLCFLCSYWQGTALSVCKVTVLGVCKVTGVRRV